MALTSAIGPTRLPFIFFFPLIAVAAWFAGSGPAILATVLAALAANWYFFEPLNAFAVGAPDLWAILAFALAAFLIIGAIDRMHRAQRGLAASRDLFSTTLRSIGDGVIVTDAQGRVTFLNGEAERLTRWTLSDAIGRPLPEIFHIVNEQTNRPTENPVDKVLRLGTTVGLANHTVLIAKDGTRVPIDDSGAPVRQTGEPLQGVVLVFRDSSEQRKAEADHARLATIVESSGDAILSKNLEGIILTWNTAAERLFGFRAEEIVGKSVLTLIPPELHHEEQDILARLRQGLTFERHETERMTKDGRRIPVSLRVSPIKDREGTVIGASKILHDVSDLVTTRDALAREKELLRTTLTSIGDGVIVTDTQGRVTMLNSEAERLTGWKTADAQGKELPAIFRIINEDTRAPVENPVDKVLRIGTIVGLANHTVLIAKDGTETPIDDSAAPIQGPGTPLFGVVLVFRDFSEQKKAQQALSRLNVDLEARVARRTGQLQETVQELETFSYTVAHDLRGPLRAMHRSAEVLLQEQSAGLTDEGRDFLRRIAEGANRMDTLIQDLLAYSRVTRSDLQPLPIDPGTILADLLVHFAPEIRERQADVQVEPSLPRLLADPVLLTQVFTNLLSNALKFVPRGSAPRVKIRAEAMNGMERIWIEDNGIGIDTRFKERLFRVFERLDSDYPGTGVGLAIVKRAVERMGGRVGFESGKDRGSRFWIELPPAGNGHERLASG
jgi:PAS domain S-box-containing protein